MTGSRISTSIMFASRKLISDVRLVPQLRRIKTEPIDEPGELRIAMASTNVKRISSWQVVAAECATEPGESGRMNHFDRRLRQLWRKPIGKGKVADRFPNHLFEFVLGNDDFAPDQVQISHLAEVDMGTSMTTDFDSSFGGLADLLDRIDLERDSNSNIVWKGALASNVAGRHEIGAGNLSLDQQGKGIVAVLGIPIIEREGDGCRRRMIAGRSFLDLGKVDHVEVLATVVDVASERVPRDGPRIGILVGDAMVKEHRNRRSPCRRQLIQFRPTKWRRKRSSGCQGGSENHIHAGLYLVRSHL